MGAAGFGASAFVVLLLKILTVGLVDAAAAAGTLLNIGALLAKLGTEEVNLGAEVFG